MNRITVALVATIAALVSITGASAGLSHDEAYNLAIGAAYKGSTDSLRKLNSAAKSGDVEAMFGLGRYYGSLLPQIPIIGSPLFDDLLKKEDPRYDKFFANEEALKKQYPEMRDAKLARDKANYAKLSTQWFLAAAQRGEPESEALIGHEYLRQVMSEISLLTFVGAFLGGGNGEWSPEVRRPAVNAMHQMCDLAFGWINTALKNQESPKLAQVYATLGLSYTMGGLRQSNPNQESMRMLGVEAGCYRDDPRLADIYFEKAAELGEAGSINMMVEKYLRANNLVKAEYWRQKAYENLMKEVEEGRERSPQMIECFKSLTCMNTIFH